VYLGDGFSRCLEYRLGTPAALLRSRCDGGKEAYPLLRILHDGCARPETVYELLIVHAFDPGSAGILPPAAHNEAITDLYLETWLHGIVRTTREKDAPFRVFAGKGGLGRVTRSNVEAYQFYKLRQILRYSYERSSFYRGLFRTAGIEPEDIRNPGDLSKVPLTESESLSENPYRFLCLSRAEIARPYTFVTSGTTGPRKKIFWTQGDLERITDFMAAGIGTVADSDDVVQIILPDGRPNSQSDLLSKGVTKLGARSVPAGVDLSPQEHLNLIERFHSSVLFGSASHLFRISKELQAQYDLHGKGVKVLFLAAEYLPDARRRELQKIWNCHVHTHYGLTEMGLGVAVECEAENGYHFNEADLLLEVISPRTGKPVAAGEEGELVFTTLNREAMPLIRYRTHDISRLITEPCPCGVSTLLKIDRVRKRLESIITIGDGDEIYPALFDDALYEIPGLMDYQVVVTREGNKDRLRFKIEMTRENADPIPEINRKLLSEPVIAKNIAAGTMVAPAIEIVGWGTLKSASRAKKMIVDRR
jgi:phenylacetate-CoA ligase